MTGHFGPTSRPSSFTSTTTSASPTAAASSSYANGVSTSSAGQLSHILTERHQSFHCEKEQLLLAGLATSAYIHVDDTGARHRGKNGYCTHIGNERFAYFQSTASKSRINFLELLRGPRTDYRINDAAMQYLRTHKLPRAHDDAWAKVPPTSPTKPPGIPTSTP